MVTLRLIAARNKKRIRPSLVWIGTQLSVKFGVRLEYPILFQLQGRLQNEIRATHLS